MSIRAANSDFEVDLTGSLARLRVYALSLTHDRDRADDLVQQTVLKALVGRESFLPGSNFKGWIFRILRNEFISDLRRNRPTLDIYGEVADLLSVPPRQEDGLVLREFIGAFRELKRGSRETLLLVHLDGWSHRRIADRSGISVGTVKSRIWRSRAKLTRLMNPPAIPSAAQMGQPRKPG